MPVPEKSQSLLKFEFFTVCITASWIIFISRLSFAMFLGVCTFCSVPQKNEIGFLEGVLCVWLVKESRRFVASLAEEFV